LSDEGVCERWVYDPYFQYFTGEEFFQHVFPHERSDLTNWRQRLGDKLELLLAESLRVAHASGALPTKDLERVTVDTTVQPKAVTFPTDPKLLHAAIRGLCRLAKKHWVQLRQSYLRVDTTDILFVCGGAFMIGIKTPRPRRNTEARDRPREFRYVLELPAGRQRDRGRLAGWHGQSARQPPGPPCSPATCPQMISGLILNSATTPDSSAPVSRPRQHPHRVVVARPRSTRDPTAVLGPVDRPPWNLQRRLPGMTLTLNDSPRTHRHATVVSPNNVSAAN
jgi:hypothetical protein